MLKRLILAAALAAGLASPALAQQQQYGGVTLYDLRGQPLGTSSNPVYVSGAGGGTAGSTGTVGSAGTNGTVAQSVQGIVGGVPQNGFVGQYNSTLPTFSSAQVGYLAMDSNGRLILSPGGSISVANFPATQAVSGTITATQGTTPWVVSGNATANGSGNPIFVQVTTLPSVGSASAGTAATQSLLTGGIYNATPPSLATGQQAGLQLDSAGNLRVVDNSAVVADQGAVTTASPTYTNGTNAALSLTTAGALRTDASNTTQPVSAATLPLPTGAATSANQTSEISALGATGDSAYAGSGTSSIIAALKGVYNATLALPSGAATSANQTSEISALGTTADTAYAGSGNSSIVAALKGIFNQFTSATVKVQGSIWFNEGVSQSVAASGTFSGTSRGNVAAGSVSSYGYFQAQVLSTQTGTLSISNGAYSITQAVTANTPTTLKIPALGGGFTASYVNGSTAATVSLLDGYTLN